MYNVCERLRSPGQTPSAARGGLTVSWRDPQSSPPVQEGLQERPFASVEAASRCVADASGCAPSLAEPLRDTSGGDLEHFPALPAERGDKGSEGPTDGRQARRRPARGAR